MAQEQDRDPPPLPPPHGPAPLPVSSPRPDRLRPEHPRPSEPVDSHARPGRCFAALVGVAAIVAGAAACSRAPQGNTAAQEPPRPVKQAQVPARAEPAAPEALSPRSISLDAITDSAITARTKAEILADPGMGGTDVSVNTDHGVVSLTGIIRSQEQAALASAHAQRQDGVMRVDNQLAVNLR